MTSYLQKIVFMDAEVTSPNTLTSSLSNIVMAESRSATLKKEDLDLLLDDKDAKSTKRATKSALKVFHQYLKVVSGHKNEASIRSYSKTDICTKKKMSETLTAECEVRKELSVMNPNQSSPILSLSQEEVILNNSRSEITKNFNFFNCNVNIQPVNLYKLVHTVNFNYNLMCCTVTILFCALLSLQLLRYMHNKTIIGFGFHMIAGIIKASVCVIRLRLRLRQVTQTSALIILAIMLNLLQ